MLSGRLRLEDIQQVYSATFDFRSKWYDIGLALKIDATSLDAIWANNSHNVQDCLYSMLAVWLKRSEPKPTWAELKRAMKYPTSPVDRNQLLSKLPSKLILKIKVGQLQLSVSFLLASGEIS